MTGLSLILDDSTDKWGNVELPTSMETSHCIPGS